MRQEKRKQLGMPRWLATGIAAFSMPFATSAIADEIYHWIDAEGEVHYSDTLPAHDAEVSVVEVEAGPAVAYNAAEDPYSILNQAARIHENWLELEEVRQARVQERIDARAASRPEYPPPDYYEYDSYLGYSSYPYYSYWPVGTTGYRRGEGREQIYALNTLDLLGPRPSSINSGVHQDRVFRSQFLPLVPPPPVAQPLPR